MKNQFSKFTIHLSVILMMLMIGTSCSNEDKNVVEDDNSLTLNQVKSWYASNVKESPVFAIHESMFKMIPDWQKATYSSNGELEVFEVPYTSDEFFSYKISIGEQSYHAEMSENYANSSNFRMVFTRNKAGEIDALTMLIIPETGRKADMDMDQNSYLSLQNDFSGIVYYYELNSMLIEGKEYIYGNVANNFHPENKLLKIRESEFCPDHQIYETSIAAYDVNGVCTELVTYYTYRMSFGKCVKEYHELRRPGTGCSSGNGGGSGSGNPGNNPGGGTINPGDGGGLPGMQQPNDSINFGGNDGPIMW